jgi:hypothetical protein
VSEICTSRARDQHARLRRLDSIHAAHETAARPQVDCLVVVELLVWWLDSSDGSGQLYALLSDSNARPAGRLIAIGDGIGQSGGLFLRF